MMLQASSAWFETAQRLFPFFFQPCWQAIRQGDPACVGAAVLLQSKLRIQELLC